MAQASQLKLQRGQRIRAQVEEVLGPSTLIVSFSGNLVRVLNSSQKDIHVGDWLDLQVVATDPPEFRFFQRSQSFERVI